MRTLMVAALVLALACCMLSAAWAAPAPQGKVVQEKVTLKEVKGLGVDFLDTNKQVVTMWVSGAKLFREGRLADGKGIKPGSKWVARYYKGKPYNWLYILMDEVSVPVVADILNRSQPVTVVKMNPATKTVTCKVKGANRDLRMTSTFFCVKDGHEAQVVPAKAPGQEKMYGPGDTGVAALTPDGGKMRCLVDKKTFDKFMQDMKIMPGVNTQSPSSSK